MVPELATWFRQIVFRKQSSLIKMGGGVAQQNQASWSTV